MDGDRFDNLSRRLAAGISRRGAVKGAVAGALGALGLRTAADAQVTQAQCGNVVCRGNACACTNDCVCCTYSNGNSRCRPPGTCSPGTESVCAPPTTTPAPTTAAPTTTTTTSTTTTTTTAFPGPTQGTCQTGADDCIADNGNCNGTPGCFCRTGFDGGTVCVGVGGGCTDCNSHADCAAFGPGSACINVGQNRCQTCEQTNGRYCIPGCSTPA